MVEEVLEMVDLGTEAEGMEWAVDVSKNSGEPIFAPFITVNGRLTKEEVLTILKTLK